jgi:hypothetical protein
MPKSDTPVKPTTKTTSVSNSKSISISNEDLMAPLKSFKREMISSHKSQSDLQASQYNDLKAALSHVSLHMSELKAENSMLRTEIDALKNKVASLEGISSVEQSQSILQQVLQETFEREICQTNLIAYGVPESPSLDISSRITQDKNTFCNILLTSIGDSVPSNFKLVRFGKPSNSAPRPLKVTFESKYAAAHLLSSFNTAKRLGTVFLDNFCLNSDKTLLQRKLLCSCHSELDQRTKDGESGLRIILENGFPKVVVTISKNGEV